MPTDRVLEALAEPSEAQSGKMLGVSVVLPTHNGARYLAESIDSCLDQTYSDIELIVVVDGSTDRTYQILEAYSDSRIRVIRNAVNQGLPESLNIGFRQARGRYLTWTSDDNHYASHAIATMVSYLEAHPEVSFVYAPFWELDEDDHVLALNPCAPPNTILESNPVGACFLYRRAVYDTVGDYDPTTRWFEDYNYWLRVSRHFVMHRLDEPLYYYRIHAGALTSRSGVRFQRKRKGIRMKRERFGLSWWVFQRQMSAVDIEEAFACYRDGQFSRVAGLAIRGVVRNPLGLRNLGITSIAVRSVWRTVRMGLR